MFVIDYDNIENNDFLVFNQMKYKGVGNNSIPDIVVYVNGLHLAVIEVKSPKVQTKNVSQCKNKGLQIL